MIPALVIALLTATAPFYEACRDLSGDVLRVHIVANSDSAADQSLKLAVRDRITAECAELFDGCGSREEAIQAARAHLPQLQRLALDEVRRQGFDYSVKAELVDMYFDTRYYDEFTMPAGRYKALRLRIGAGEGRNWWCVLSPARCIGAACRETAREALSGGEYRVISSDRADFRFKIVEWFEGFLDWLW